MTWTSIDRIARDLEPKQPARKSRQEPVRKSAQKQTAGATKALSNMDRVARDLPPQKSGQKPAAGPTSAQSNIDRVARDLPPQKSRQKPAAGAADKWSREQIQRARRTPLAPLLEKRGYRLRKKPGGNYLVEDEGDLVVKEFYWIWESREMKGNAIDFLMLVECRSFGQAMEILTADD